MSTPGAIWALVPAAGQGQRLQSALPKQYHLLLGRPVILHTLNRLCTHQRIRGVLAGISLQDVHWQKLSTELKRLPKFLGKYPGGDTRAETVLNGLKELTNHATPEDWVLVHDAVRPCVRHADINKLITATIDTVMDKSPMSHSGAGNQRQTADGGLLAFPIADTVKRAGDDGHVIETVEREGLWRAATPQLFRIGALMDALQKAMAKGNAVTDEATAMEAAGKHPRVVACHSDNIKITVPEDLALAEMYLKQQGKT